MRKPGLQTVTFEVPERKLNEFDEAIKDEYGNNRSAALRDLMRQFVREKKKEPS